MMCKTALRCFLLSVVIDTLRVDCLVTNYVTQSVKVPTIFMTTHRASNFSDVTPTECFAKCLAMGCNQICVSKPDVCYVTDYIIDKDYTDISSGGFVLCYAFLNYGNVALLGSAECSCGSSSGSPRESVFVDGLFTYKYNECFVGKASLLEDWIWISFSRTINFKQVVITHINGSDFNVYVSSVFFSIGLINVASFLLTAYPLKLRSSSSDGLLDNGKMVYKSVFDTDGITLNKRYLVILANSAGVALEICNLEVYES